MIESGFKPEEYREIKPYWIKRLKYEFDGYPEKHSSSVFLNDFTHVQFARGGHFHKSIPQMQFVLDEISVGTGQEKWGAEPGKKYFVIKLGEKV